MRIKAAALASDPDAFLDERNPARQAINAAVIDAQAKVRSDQMEEQAVRTVTALARSMKH